MFNFSLIIVILALNLWMVYILATGKLMDGLYHLELQDAFISGSSINTVVSKTCLSAIWNLHLGHASSAILHKIPGVCDSVVNDHNQ